MKSTVKKFIIIALPALSFRIEKGKSREKVNGCACVRYKVDPGSQTAQHGSDTRLSGVSSVQQWCQQLGHTVVQQSVRDDHRASHRMCRWHHLHRLQAHQRPVEIQRDRSEQLYPRDTWPQHQWNWTHRRRSLSLRWTSHRCRWRHRLEQRSTHRSR